MSASGGLTPYSYTLQSGGNAPISGLYGTIQLNSDGSYTYTLTSPVTDSLIDDGANTVTGAESFTYVATDHEGNTTTGTININIVDDVPQVETDSVTIIPGGSNVSGDVSAVFGADGPGSLIFNIQDSAAVQTAGQQDLYLDGELLSWSLNTAATQATAQTADGDIGFVVDLNSDGTFTVSSVADGLFTVESDFLDFPASNDLTSGNDEIYGISNIGGSSVDVIMRGYDGTATATVNNSTQGFAVGGGQTIDSGDRLVFDFHNNLSVPGGSDYLDAIPNGLDVGLVTGFKFEVGRVQSNGTANFDVVAFDKDGNEITTGFNLSTNSAGPNTLVDFTSSTPVSSFEIVGTGGLGFTVFLDSISVFEPSDHSLDLPVQITDADGDTDPGNISLTIDQTINEVSASGAVDDVPEVAADDLVVDEDDIDYVAGNPGGPGNPGGQGDLSPLTSGSLTFDLGADTPVADVTLSVASGELETLAGEPVATVWDAGSNQLIGYVVNPGDADDTSNRVFTIDLTNRSDTGADYTVNLLQPIRHHSDENANDQEGVSGQSLEVLATVTDSDGSTGSASFTVQIDDDAPDSGSFEKSVDIRIDNLAVGSLEASWSNVQGGSSSVDNNPATQDDVVEWPTSGSQSQYRFDDNDSLTANQSVPVNSIFELGTFTHENFPITSGTAIDSVDLDLSLDVIINGYSATVEHTIKFLHDETTNTDDPEASRDVVTIENASTIVPVSIQTQEGETETYNFQIIGFVDELNNIVDQVKTYEDAKNSFTLVAKLVSSEAPAVSGLVEYNFGADGPAAQDPVIWENMVNGQIVGDHGVLTVATDGSYTYQMSQSAYDALQPGDMPTDSFTFTVTDGDGDSVTSTLDININGVEAPQAPDLQPTVTPQTAETDDVSAAGEAIDTDSGSMSFGDFNSVAFSYDGGLGAVSQSTEGDERVFAADDGSWDLRINTITGDYTFTQYSPFSHAPNQDEASGTITVTLTDADNDSAEAALTLKITDDGVVASSDQGEALEGESTLVKENLALIIDTSGSMDFTDGDGVSRLTEVKQAIAELFDTGKVNSVYIVTFASGASTLNGGNWYTDLGAALAAVNALSADGGTDYDDALDEAMDGLVNTPPPPGGTVTKAIFMSDGEPSNWWDGVDSSEEAGWINFLQNNGFDEAYAIGFGGIGADEIEELEPIAVSEGENANTYTDATAANDDNVIIVASGGSIGDALEQTLEATPVTGNVLDNDDGVDVPLTVASVSHGGVTHDFDSDGEIAVFTLSEGGTDYGRLEIGRDGAYTFSLLEGVDITEALLAEVSYFARDADGDTDQATLTLQALPAESVAPNSGGEPENRVVQEPESVPFNQVTATGANDTLAALVGPDVFVWGLSSVQGVQTSEMLNEGGLELEAPGNSGRSGNSESFTVQSGDSVTLEFSLSIDELDEAQGGGGQPRFAWHLEKDGESGWEFYQAGGTFDAESSEVSDGEIDSLSQSVSVSEPGTYRLVFEAERGVDAAVSAITLDRDTSANTDTVINFDPSEDALDVADLLDGGGSLSLNFESGSAQVVIKDAGGNGVDQVINLAEVSESLLETALGLDPGSDANAIIQEMMNQNKLITDS